MFFTIERDILLDNLNILQKGLPVKTPMPVLTGIKLEVFEDKMLTKCSYIPKIRIDINSIARKEKNWAVADSLRAKLTEMGYIVKNTPTGYELTKK